MKLKQILLTSILAMTLSVTLLPTQALAAENLPTKIANTEDLGLTIVTGDVPTVGKSLDAQVEGDISIQAVDEKAITKRFAHNIEGKAVTVTIKGYYSEGGRYAEITDIALTTSSTLYPLSLTIYWNGNKGSLNVSKYNSNHEYESTYLYSYSYILNYNGTITSEKVY
jgi:hypothetical protein